MSDEMLPKEGDYSLRTYKYLLDQLTITLTQDLAEERQNMGDIFGYDQEKFMQLADRFADWADQFFTEREIRNKLAQGAGHGTGQITFINLFLRDWLCNKDISTEEKTMLFVQVLSGYSENLYHSVDAYSTLQDEADEEGEVEY